MSGQQISLKYLLFGEDKSATSTVHKVGGAFSKLGSQVGGEFGEILDRVGDGIDRMGDHAQTLGGKLTAVGGITAGVGVAFQLAGSKEAQGAAQLNAAIDATGRAHEDYKEQVEGAIHANEKFGFGAADTQQALAKLTAATNDPNAALKAMGITANLAASQHISLADASKMVARVMAGTGGRTLAQYGIQMDATKSKTAAGQEALAQLSAKLNGQASAAVDSFGGKIKVAQTKIGDLTAQVGQKLGPALTVAGPIIMTAGAAMDIWAARQAAAAAAGEAENAVTSEGIIAKTGAAISTGVVAVATGVWTAAQWALNAALDANPIALVIIGIVALIAIFILAWKHSQTFRTIVTGAFNAVLSAVHAAWSWISHNWPLLLSILTGPVGAAVIWITRHWSTVTTFFKGVPKALGRALSSVGSFIVEPFRIAFDAIADLWNGTVGQLSFHLPDWVPGLGGKGFSMPKLPRLAGGGIVTRPTLLLAGESGPERIEPLSAGRGHGSGGGDIHIHNTFTGVIGDPAAVGDMVVQSIVKYQQRNGGRPLPLRTATARALG